MSTYRIETEDPRPGVYTDINGNTATAWGLIMASEKSGRPLFLGSYPITPATDILHELAKHKSMGVTTVQCEDEIAGCEWGLISGSSAILGSFHAADPLAM